MTLNHEESTVARSQKPVRIVSWMGGEHWYIGNSQFLRLEEAIAHCERNKLEYEIEKDPHHYYYRHDCV